MFSAGASYYGVAELSLLAQETHKFESRYLDSLVGPYPEGKATYDARSPLEHADSLSAPVVFFHVRPDLPPPPPPPSPPCAPPRQPDAFVPLKPWASDL